MSTDQAEVEHDLRKTSSDEPTPIFDELTAAVIGPVPDRPSTSQEDDETESGKVAWPANDLK
ncbi:hypothetical protein AB5J62_24210 [Amycolatopsis sp. cg5]|uniref:hypothetical protein n=1 Tax=Amycolatopsis sp. cg5 TaxID=3238802 RepID=UPI003525D1A9